MVESRRCSDSGRETYVERSVDNDKITWHSIGMLCVCVYFDEQSPFCWVIVLEQVDAIKKSMEVVAERYNTTPEALEAEHRELLASGKKQFASLEKSARDTRIMNAMSQVTTFCSNVPRVLYNYSIGLFTGHRIE
jgi:hypothetical protein